MFPERSLFCEDGDAFNRIAVKEPCVIIVTKVVWICQTIATRIARYRRVDAHRIGHFVQPFENSVGQSKVADGCHRRVPQKPVDCSSAEVVLDSPVR